MRSKPKSFSLEEEAVDCRIGQILLREGKINAFDMERILHLQKEKGLRFGEAAMELRLIGEEDIRQILAKQFDYPYLSSGKSHFSEKLIAAYQPFSSQMEIFRSIRGQLILRWPREIGKSLAIISPQSEDGRSFVASNLAVTFSQLGQKALLIDADLRRPSQHAIFALNRDGLGLSDILAGRADRESIRRISEFQDLSVLSAGTVPPNPQELLGRYRLSDLLRDLEADFDVILIDTSAALSSADAQAVAAWAGAALLLTRRNWTRLAEAEALKHQLQAAKCLLVGAVVNDF